MRKREREKEREKERMILSQLSHVIECAQGCVCVCVCGVCVCVCVCVRVQSTDELNKRIGKRI